MYIRSLMHFVSLALVFLQGQRMWHEQVTSYSDKQEDTSCPNCFAEILDDCFTCQITERDKWLSCLVLWLGFSSCGEDLRIIQTYVASKHTLHPSLQACKQSKSEKVSSLNPTKGLEVAAEFRTLRTTVSMCILTRRNMNVQRILPVGRWVLE